MRPKGPSVPSAPLSAHVTPPGATPVVQGDLPASQLLMSAAGKAGPGGAGQGKLRPNVPTGRAILQCGVPVYKSKHMLSASKFKFCIEASCSLWRAIRVLNGARCLLQQLDLTLPTPKSAACPHDPHVAYVVLQRSHCRTSEVHTALSYLCMQNHPIGSQLGRRRRSRLLELSCQCRCRCCLASGQHCMGWHPLWGSYWCLHRQTQQIAAGNRSSGAWQQVTNAVPVHAQKVGNLLVLDNRCELHNGSTLSSINAVCEHWAQHIHHGRPWQQR